MQPMGSMFTTVIDIYVRIPIAQEIFYIPGVLETLKFAWTQYQAFLIPALLIFWALIGFTFRYGILETTVISDLHNERRKLM